MNKKIIKIFIILIFLDIFWISLISTNYFTDFSISVEDLFIASFLFLTPLLFLIFTFNIIYRVIKKDKISTIMGILFILSVIGILLEILFLYLLVNLSPLFYSF